MRRRCRCTMIFHGTLVLLILVTVSSSYIIEARTKRQLFREDIPHYRPLSGNTYHHHAGFPHPGRFHENPGQIVPPNPNAPATPGPELHPGEIPDPPKLPEENENSDEGFFGPPPPPPPPHSLPVITSPSLIHFGPPAGHGLPGFIDLRHNALGSPSSLSPGLSYSWSTRHR